MPKRIAIFLICLFVCLISFAHASAIHDAVNKGNLAKVKVLLKKDPKLLNAKDENEDTPLHIAVMCHGKDVAAYLIDMGANTNITNADGYTPIQQAASLRYKGMVSFLISRGVELDIFSAVSLGDKDIISQIVGVSPKQINAQDGNGDTPLVEAIMKNKLAVARFLISNGADVNLHGPDNGSALSRAVIARYNDIVDLLISHGANVNGIEHEGATTLQTGVCCRNMAAVKKMIAAGAKVDVFSAAYLEDLAQVTQMLDTQPSNLNKIGPSGDTLLTLAIDIGSGSLVNLLLSKGAFVEQPDNQGRLPLHFAAEHGHLELARLLISKGADVNSMGGHYCGPLHAAARNGHKDLVEFLLAKGAKVNATTDTGESPMDYAIRGKHKDVVAILGKHGGKAFEPPRAK